MKQQQQSIKSQIAPGILPGVHPEALKSVSCKCEDPEAKFIPICELRHASRFQTSTGQPMLVNFNSGFACSKCGKINEFTIKGVTDIPVEKDKTLN